MIVLMVGEAVKMSSFKLLFKTCRTRFNHPLFRGMLMYSFTWPIGSLIQQSFESKEYNLGRTLRFGVYGSLYVAPSIYYWMKISSYFLPKPTLKHSMLKGLFEQVSYAPFTLTSFYFILTTLEGGSVDDGIKEVQNKLIPTWKVSALVWPALQTINYMFISEQNRIPFIGICSLCWTVFLAFMKYQSSRSKYSTSDSVSSE